MPRSRFRFDETLHRYTLDGRVVPSVTSIIHDNLLVDDASRRFFTEEARLRGTRVHKACLDLDLGMVTLDDLDDADPAFVGCMQSYVKWRDLVRPRWTLLEETRFSERYQICGCPDRGGYDGMARPLVLDFKTGGPQKWHRIQLALYDMIIGDMPWGIRRRVTLCLDKKGGLARAHEYTDKNDYAEALRLVTSRR